MSLQSDQTLFGRIPEKNVYFLIDTSGSMQHQLGFVKSHLVEILTTRAVLLQDSMFNIIQFNENATKWADSLVHCDTETVNIASQWISNLKCGTSTNTMSAIQQALNDPAVEAIYLVTDGLPDQRPAVIIDKLSSLSRKVPVHCVYLKGTYSDPTACEFLRDLARQTEGSFHIVKLSEYLGKVEQVLPIYNSKTKHYEDNASELMEHKHDTDITPQTYGNKTYGTSRNPQFEKGLTSLPHVSYTGQSSQYSGSTNFESKVLDYADTLNKARGLAQSAGIRCSSTPLASSVMKDVQVLARLDRDGLYYLGHVKEQGTNDTFVIKFESCPGLRKTTPQEISVHNMIAYKDAFRLNISLGDKVLAPWQDDGRYGPGTVLDGYERRNTQYEGDDGELLVTFFNGQTVSVKRGVAVRIPEKKYSKISLEIQLPESQRKKQPHKTDPFFSSKPKIGWDEERRGLQQENEKLKQQINDQIKENTNLIRALDLNITNNNTREKVLIGRATSRDLTHSPPVIGTATSCDLNRASVIGRASSRELLRDYDSGVFSDEEFGESEEDLTELYSENFQDCVSGPIHDKQYDLSFTPRFPLKPEAPAPKSASNTEPVKRWRYTGSSTPVTQSRSRETVLKKPREPGDKSNERPSHEEYQTVAGVSFPAGTDRKFGEKRKKWHPYRQFSDGKKTNENVSAIWERKFLKHSEYQDASGVKFPSATDKKFGRSLDVNWSPDTALRNSERSRNWEDGLGHGDVAKNARYANKLDRIRSNKRRYFKDIEDKVAMEERKEDKRIEYRRNKTAQREEDIAEANMEQEKLETTRMETRRAKQSEVRKHEIDRNEKAEQWKADRIEALKERHVKFADIESSHETKNDSKKARRQAYLRMKEHERREEFHDRLRSEWRTEDERAERLRRQSEANRENQNIRQRQADTARDARLSVKRERGEKYRASILP